MLTNLGNASGFGAVQKSSSSKVTNGLSGPERPCIWLAASQRASCLVYPEGEHLCVQAWSVFSVREHRKLATCLLEVAPGLRSSDHFSGVGPAKVGNADGGFIKQALSTFLPRVWRGGVLSLFEGC